MFCYYDLQYFLNVNFIYLFIFVKVFKNVFVFHLVLIKCLIKGLPRVDENYFMKQL